jgi:hypothetical protein
MMIERKIKEPCNFVWNFLRVSLSVLIDPEDPDFMEHGKFGQNDENHGCKVNTEVKRVVLCIERGEHEHHDWKNCQEFSCSCKLGSIINLFPMGEISDYSLISGFPRSSLDQVQEKEHCLFFTNNGENKVT